MEDRPFLPKEIKNAIKDINKAIRDLEEDDKKGNENLDAAKDLLKAVKDLDCEENPAYAPYCDEIAQVFPLLISPTCTRSCSCN